jgi:hypothetical protein
VLEYSGRPSRHDVSHTLQGALRIASRGVLAPRHLEADRLQRLRELDRGAVSYGSYLINAYSLLRYLLLLSLSQSTRLERVEK